jgi:NMD protein affecting ribosome stability and mRNA decay
MPLMGPKEVAVCKRCGAVYHRKRWSIEKSSDLLKGGKIRSVVCPACQKTKDDFPGGIITLDGEFLKSHKGEILHLIRNEETRAKRINPLERIISIKDQGKSVEVHATSDRFAQRIGMEIHRAYKGDVEYHWSRDDKFIRVKWQRGQEQ